MSLVDDLRELFTGTIILEPFTALDSYGSPTWGSGIAYPARIQQRARRIRNAQGDEVTSMTQVYLATVPESLTIRDRVTLPAPYAPTQPPILALARSPDDEGGEVVVVYC